MFPIVVLLTLLSQAPAPAVYEGAKLERVPGPTAPVYPDPAMPLDGNDLQAQMRRQARKANLIARVVPALPAVVEDKIGDISGWRAYRVEAPPGMTVKVRLHGTHEGWFRVRTVNRWGHQEQGMLQNRIPTGNPEASFINPKQEKTTLFFLVDTTEMGAERDVFRLEFTLK